MRCGGTLSGVAYPSELTAALSGATVRQLAYWRRPNASGERLLVPELRQAGRPLLYSFRDVIALRTFVYLRGEHSLQKVRKAVSTLRDLGNREHLAAYQLVATPSSIIWVDETGAGTDLVRKPRHRVLDVSLADIVAEFEGPDRRVVDLLRPRKLLGVDPELCGGYPVVAGTRVLYDQVASLVADGVPADRVGSYYPGVTADAALDAANFADEVAGLAS